MTGRGTESNPHNRFERITVTPDPGEEETCGRNTVLLRDESQSLITYNDSADVPFDAGINPYRGCEHGCVYCYARPTHEFLGFSAGLDFESRILVKENAPELLRRELSKRSWRPQPIGLSGITDPYQPVEGHLKLTRACLDVLLDFRNPVGIITKNALILRDLDLLQSLNTFDCASVHVSITTLDPVLQQRMEPRTATPRKRLQVIRTLADAGIPVGVLVAPCIPGLTDHEMVNIISAAGDAGAQTAGFIPIRLPHGVADLFSDWLERHYPLKKDTVLERIREMRGGALHDGRIGHRMRGQGQQADMMRKMFRVAVKRAGLNTGERVDHLSTRHFRRPFENGQLGLFE